MNIQDLKPMQVIYDVYNMRVVRYRYFCVHPRRNKYHILFNDSEDPIKIYDDFLQRILNKNLGSYEEAVAHLKESMRKYIEDL